MPNLMDANQTNPPRAQRISYEPESLPTNPLEKYQLASNQPTSQTDAMINSYMQQGVPMAADSGSSDTFLPASAGGTPQVQQPPVDPVSAAIQGQQAANINVALAQQSGTYPGYESDMQAAENQAAMQQKAIADAYTQEKDKATREYQDLSTKYAEAKVIDPMDKWGTGRKVQAAIAIALGAFGSAMTGQKNSALEIINGAIERDIAMQKAEIERLGTGAKQKQNFLADLRERYQDDLQATNMAKAVQIGKIQEKVKAVAEASKNKLALANAMKLNADLEVERQKYLAQKSEGSTQKLSEKQYAAFTSSNAMEFANTDLERMGEYATAYRAGVQDIIPYGLRSAERQALDTARAQFTESYMRYASGAAIADSEIERTLESALPRAGESAEMIKKKSEFRKNLINDIKMVSTGKISQEEFNQRTAREQAARFGAKPK